MLADPGLAGPSFCENITTRSSDAGEPADSVRPIDWSSGCLSTVRACQRSVDAKVDRGKHEGLPNRAMSQRDAVLGAKMIESKQPDKPGGNDLGQDDWHNTA